MAWLDVASQLLLHVLTLGSTVVAVCHARCVGHAFHTDAAHGCDVLSHEATFARGMEPKARTAQHSTASMAGAFARQIRAKYDVVCGFATVVCTPPRAPRRLVLTHFSRRYDMMMVNDPRGVAPEEERNPDALDEEFDSNNVQSLLQEVRGWRWLRVLWVSRHTLLCRRGKRLGETRCLLLMIYTPCQLHANDQSSPNLCNGLISNGRLACCLPCRRACSAASKAQPFV